MNMEKEIEICRQIRILNREFANALQDEAVEIRKQLVKCWKSLLEVRKANALA